MKVKAFLALGATLLFVACGARTDSLAPSVVQPPATLSPAPTQHASTSSPLPSPGPTVIATATPSFATTLPSPVGEQPPRCSEPDLIFDPTLKELLLVNCVAFDAQSDRLTVWAWNGGGWRVVSSGDAPARVVGGAALDLGRDALVVYGGYLPQAAHCSTETWELSVAGWSQIDAEPPPACDHMKMIYDPAGQQSLLVGGQDDLGSGIDETWAWDGTAWQQIDAHLPPSRAHFGLQYDSGQDQVLLYGGLTTTAVLGDFWARREGHWKQLDLTDPGPRSHVAMVYDANNNSLYLYGGAKTGDSYESLTDEMWVLTDGAWHQLSPATSPGARGSAVMAYDPERDQIVLYGGFEASGNELDDTWLWDGQTWSCAANCP